MSESCFLVEVKGILKFKSMHVTVFKSDMNAALLWVQQRLRQTFWRGKKQKNPISCSGGASSIQKYQTENINLSSDQQLGATSCSWSQTAAHWRW